jgi:hypothetical protein
MPLQDRPNLQRGTATLELDDIQATVLRDRPEPYYGTHVLLHGGFPVCEGGVLTRLYQGNLQPREKESTGRE